MNRYYGQSPGRSASSSAYSSAGLLTFHWEKTDENLRGVRQEAEEVRKFFSNPLHYDVKNFEIPLEGSHMAVLKTATDFISKYDSPNKLVIIYYGGHGDPNSDKAQGQERRSVWAAFNQGGPTVEWYSIQDALKTQADILVILDCCYAAQSGRGREATQQVELLAACGVGEIAPEPGENSFTSILLRELRNHLDSHGSVTISQVHKAIMSRMSGYGHSQTPVHVELARGVNKGILLAPLPPPKSSYVPDEREDKNWNAAISALEECVRRRNSNRRLPVSIDDAIRKLREEFLKNKAHRPDILKALYLEVASRLEEDQFSSLLDHDAVDAVTLKTDLRKLKARNFQGKPDLKFDEDDVPLPSETTETPSMLKYVTLEESPHFLEYLPFPHDYHPVKGKIKPSRAVKRIERLTSCLNEQERERLRTLRCEGWFERERQFGLLFSPEPGYETGYGSESEVEPMSLRNALRSRHDLFGRPSEAERFHMSRVLVRALGAWHESDWIHQSMNISSVLFLRRLGDRFHDWSNPFLCDFTRSCPSDMASVPLGTSTHQQDIHRHPACVGDEETFRRKEHDIYSLGVVLLQIALWEEAKTKPPVAEALKPGKSAYAITSALLSLVHENKDKSMNNDYWTAVRNCLSLDVPDQDDEARTNLLKAFQEQVTKYIEQGEKESSKGSS